jgi:hypothetical protein
MGNTGRPCDQGFARTNDKFQIQAAIAEIVIGAAEHAGSH